MCRFALFLLVGFASATLLLGCGHSSIDPDVELPSVEFADFAHFDTSGFMLLKTDADSIETRPELYLWWEKNFGEPFIDMNGNGVYDEGIDTFRIAVLPENNHDLNRNGQYDGPDIAWTPGVPFDDIDGNGTLRCEPMPYLDHYVSGLPYCDFNGNGQWDSLPGHDRYDMVCCSVATQTSSATEYGFYIVDSAFCFTSDSGSFYSLIPRGYWDAGFDLLLRSLIFELSESGLLYKDNSLGLTMRILDAGTIRPDTSWVDVEFDGDYARVSRMTNLNQSLQIGDSIYSDLVFVRCSRLEPVDPDWEILTNAFWEFYFSSDLGLIAFHFVLIHDEMEEWIYFETRYDSIPLTMTR